jgi:hypothetical protein
MKPHSVLLAGLVSALALAGCATYDEQPYRTADGVRYAPYSPDPYAAGGRYRALEIYSLPDFRGDTMKFDADGISLDKMIANDGVGSLVIREGRWELCTGARLQGYCRVYEPGRYSRLGTMEGAPVNSLRRVG